MGFEMKLAIALILVSVSISSAYNFRNQVRVNPEPIVKVNVAPATGQNQNSGFTGFADMLNQGAKQNVRAVNTEMGPVMPLNRVQQQPANGKERLYPNYRGEFYGKPVAFDLDPNLLSRWGAPLGQRQTASGTK
jgi:hypothetical protein